MNAKASKGVLANLTKLQIKPPLPVADVRLLVDPESCSVWEGHSRLYERLTEDNCRDLLDALVSAGSQLEPATVREVEDKGIVRYEVIAGARRLWCARWLRDHGYPDFGFSVRVEVLSNKEAFLRSTRTECSGKSVSAYEKGKEYQHALDYFDDQGQMAKAVGIQRTLLNKYLRIARIPIQIAGAYGELDDFWLKHASPLSALLEDSSTVSDLMDTATRLKAEQQARRADGLPYLRGSEVFRRLKEGAKGSEGGGPLHVYDDVDDPILIVESKTRNQLRITIPLPVNVSALRAAFRKCVTAYIGRENRRINASEV
ncbi:MAG: hypothetical protein GKR90_25635 [Pseudomonadales bacterium]|nr:hypothetical protein [Pseudomonadales bacterium]